MRHDDFPWQHWSHIARIATLVQHELDLHAWYQAALPALSRCTGLRGGAAVTPRMLIAEFGGAPFGPALRREP